MRLNRGSGVRGLAGMRPRRCPGDRTAPASAIAGLAPDELAAICAATGVAPAADPSNDDDNFERVRVRRGLAEADWLEPNGLARSAEHLAAANKALEWATEREWLDSVDAGPGEIVYHASTAPAEIRRRIVSRAVPILATEGDAGDLRGRELDRLMADLKAGRTAPYAASAASAASTGASPPPKRADRKKPNEDIQTAEKAAVRPAIRAGSAPCSTRNVAVVSYPKSGRTWLHFMLTSAGLKLLFIHAGAENSKANRLEDISGMPATWRDRRIIFLFRDPRDTVVSCFFQATKRLKPSQRFPGTIGEFIRDPRYGIAKIAGFNLLWLEAFGAFRDYVSVSYEDLHRNTAGELDRLIRFVTGKPADPQTLEQAVAAGSFDNMRRVETSLGEKMDERLKLGGGNPDDPESLKTRKGKVGGWREISMTLTPPTSTASSAI